MQSCLVKTSQTEIAPSLIGEITGISPNNIISGLNWLIIDPIQNKSIGIDEIRLAISWLSKTQINFQSKVLQINSADLMTNEAQNSLLKMLEEPGDNNQILLVSQFPDQLLPTILSRCRLVNLNDASQLKINPSESEIKQVNCLLAQTPAEAISTIEAAGLVKDRLLIKKLLFAFIYCCQKNVLAAADVVKLNQSDRLTIVRLASQSLGMLETNTNSRLVIETFLLDLPRGH